MRKHNRKIYYSTGLISILLLPLLCILHLKNNDAFTHYGVICYQTWDGKEDATHGTKGITRFLNSKKYAGITLTGNNNSDKTKLDIAQKSLRQLIVSKDSINGIKFHFGQKSEYWTFIKALDILQVEKAGFYAVYKDDIWFANPRVPKPNKNLKQIKPFICGYRPNYITEEKTLIKWGKIRECGEKYYLLIIVYSLMVYFTIKKTYEN